MTSDSHDELTVDPGTPAGPDLAALRRIWEILEAGAPLAATEELMRISHDDVEFHSYSAQSVTRPGDGAPSVMRGREQAIAFFRQAEEDGVSVKAWARSFEVEGDCVLVNGSTRVVRPDGSFAETKLRWSYRFRDGLIDEITWAPRAGE